mmetsp:Transcript_7896/g.33242  ORF Transcript_7896/g.33242 Transcript_7896/m.33242 type:complete len:210 (-) Transcript_7896:1656-2285(-)
MMLNMIQNVSVMRLHPNCNWTAQIHLTFSSTTGSSGWSASRSLMSSASSSMQPLASLPSCDTAETVGVLMTAMTVSNTSDAEGEALGDACVFVLVAIFCLKSDWSWKSTMTDVQRLIMLCCILSHHFFTIAKLASSSSLRMLTGTDSMSMSICFSWFLMIGPSHDVTTAFILVANTTVSSPRRFPQYVLSTLQMTAVQSMRLPPIEFML